MPLVFSVISEATVVCIQGVVVQLDVSEDRSRAGQRHGVAGGGKGEGRHDHFVARPNAGGEETEVEAGGAGVHGNGRAPVHEHRREFGFKLRYLLALGQHSGGEYGIYGRPLFIADDRLCCGDKVQAHALSSASFRKFSSSTYLAPVSGQTQNPSTSRSGKPAFPTQPSRLAGTPAIKAKAGTSFVTTAPAAMVAQRPIVTGATQTARAPMDAPSSMVTPTGVQSCALFNDPSGLTERGRCRS